MQQENKDTATIRSGPLQFTLSFSQVCEKTVLTALQSMSPADLADPECVTGTLLSELESRINVENAYRQGLTKWKVPQELAFWQIAMIIADLYHVCRIPTAEESTDTSYDLLAIYQENGLDRGIYTTSEEAFRTIARQYNCALTGKSLLR